MFKVSVLVPYRTEETIRIDNWFYCWRWWNAFFPHNYEFEICIGSDNDGDFNRSRARNEAFEKSSGDILIIADADTIVDTEHLSQSIKDVSLEKTPWSIPYADYYNLSREYSDKVKDAFPLHKPSLSDSVFSFEHKVLSWAGINVMPREAYSSIGGYDERFEGWSWEDVAFRVKLDAEWGAHQRPDYGNAYHLWHPIAAGDEFTTQNTKSNRQLFLNEYANRYNWKDERLAK